MPCTSQKDGGGAFRPPRRPLPPRANTKYSEETKKFCLDKLRLGWSVRKIAKLMTTRFQDQLLIGGLKSLIWC